MSRMLAVVIGGALAVAPAAAQTPPELLFQAEAQTLNGACTGQAVRLEGNHNTVTLSGRCGALLLKGVANTVRLGVAPGGSIRVEGSGNRVQFAPTDELPSIVALGPDNDVAAGPPEPPISPTPRPASKPAPPAGPLVLAGDDQHRVEDCRGQEVTIAGQRSDYLIRGGCKSVVLRGDLVTVQVDLSAGAKVSVTGRGSSVSWVVRAKGPVPVVIVRGEGSRVQRLAP